MASKKTPDSAEPAAEDTGEGQGARRKEGPTPSRREAEAARRERLNPTLSPKEARRRQRYLNAVRQQQATAAQEATPLRSLIRDVIDARWNPGEILLPVLILGLAVSLIPFIQNYSGIVIALVWGYMGSVILDGWLVWRRIKRMAAERYPGEPLRGMLSYSFGRQITTRGRRRPAPRVNKGDSI